MPGAPPTMLPTRFFEVRRAPGPTVPRSGPGRDRSCSETRYFHYTDKFRRQAVDLYESTEGATLKGIAGDLGIARGTLAE